MAEYRGRSDRNRVHDLGPGQVFALQRAKQQDKIRTIQVQFGNTIQDLFKKNIRFLHPLITKTQHTMGIRPSGLTFYRLADPWNPWRTSRFTPRLARLRVGVSKTVILAITTSIVTIGANSD